MLDTNAIRKSFSRAAVSYDDYAKLQQRIRAECIKIAQDYFPEKAHILDVGSGTGALKPEIAQDKPGWDVTSLDLSYGMCARACSQSRYAVNADACSMPFADGSFDAVFSSLMLQWVNDPLKAFREMARVLKPGGRCVLATLTQGTLQELREVFALVDDAPHVNEFIHEGMLLTMGVHAGFIMLSVKDETIVEHHPDAVALMRSLKSIGASNHNAKRRKGLLTPRHLKELEKQYAGKFGSKQGLPATWRVFYLLMEKK